MRVSDIHAEIRTIIFEGIATGKKMPAEWIAGTVLASHPIDDTDYTELARHQLARICTRKVLNELKDREDAETPLFPGFAHMQLAYSVTEKTKKADAKDDDEPQSQVTIVPTELMTDEQLLERAAEYRRMGEGCFAHAAEIERYVNGRRAARESA